jgi:hypothetical protein
MKIAQQKLDSNIAEYLLYMYQIEDLIRGCGFDLERICDTVVYPVVSDEKEREAYKAWYKELIKQLKVQGKVESGHLNDLEEIKMEMFYLHTTLLNMLNDEKYKEAHAEAIPFIKEFQAKSNSAQLNEVEVCLNAIYMNLLMRLKKQDITKETGLAFDKFIGMLKLLTTSFHKMKRGDMNYINN